MEIDFDRPEIQEALRALYINIKNHEDFWNRWLSDRLQRTGNLSVGGSPSEKEAAVALGSALRTIAIRAALVKR